MPYEAFIASYGPFAVFFLLMLSGFGIPVGEDVITIPAGVLIAKDKLDFWPTFTAAYLGVVFADLLWFHWCSRFGTRLLHRKWFKRLVHPRRLLQAKHQIEQKGVWVMVVSRFVPGTRTTAITVAGLLHMPWWKFATVEVICVAITGPMQIGVGYLIGRNILPEDDTSLIFWLLAIVVVVSMLPVVMGWVMAWRAARHERPRRAKAAWLRRFRPRAPARKLRSRPQEN